MIKQTNNKSLKIRMIKSKMKKLNSSSKKTATIKMPAKPEIRRTSNKTNKSRIKQRKNLLKKNKLITKIINKGKINNRARIMIRINKKAPRYGRLKRPVYVGPNSKLAGFLRERPMIKLKIRKRRRNASPRIKSLCW